MFPCGKEAASLDENTTKMVLMCKRMNQGLYLVQIQKVTHMNQSLNLTKMQNSMKIRQKKSSQINTYRHATEWEKVFENHELIFITYRDS